MLHLFEGTDDSARKQATARLKAEVVRTLGLAEDDAVLVTELACTEPGCPPRETVVAVMRKGTPTARWKFHKAAEDLGNAELRQALSRDLPHPG